MVQLGTASGCIGVGHNRHTCHWAGILAEGASGTAVQGQTFGWVKGIIIGEEVTSSLVTFRCTSEGSMRWDRSMVNHLMLP